MTDRIDHRSLVLFDIDGTLTDDPNYSCGTVIAKRVSRVVKLLESGLPIVIWSAGGGNYAQRFMKMNSLNTHGDIIAIGKPRFCVDDHSTIREGGLIIRPPEWLDR